ncbi:hypothetical protein [Micromonospora sp. CPCC 206061]|uniref:hypothetical protein n=1 Tax=Micromonospora sp. CPCC 206061 TaxID=3122410 RepID=UPI002FF273F6
MTLEELLDDLYVWQERVSAGDIRRAAIAADLPAAELTRIDALPEGEYSQDEALDALNETSGGTL